jgi:hypothetical protein
VISATVSTYDPAGSLSLSSLSLASVLLSKISILANHTNPRALIVAICW